MTRDKDFEQAALDNCADWSHCHYFEAGAEYGYQYAVDKACEWFEEKAIHGWIEDEEVDKFIELFRKAMQ